MRFSKIICIVGLFLLISLVSPAQEENLSVSIQDVFPFSSSEELYRTIKEFSEKELGMPLTWKIPEETINSQELPVPENITDYSYSVFACPKLKFWSEDMPLCSLYVYGDTFPPSDNFMEYYDTLDYDINSDKVARFGIAEGDKQRVPFISLTEKFTDFESNLSTILHEGFHNHAERKKVVPGGYNKRQPTILNRTLEESAANVVGEQTAQLFIIKYCLDPDLVQQAQEKQKNIGRSQAKRINSLYDTLSTIFASDLPDSAKTAKKKEIAGHMNNADISERHFYTRYYNFMTELWYSTNDPKTSIDILLQVLKKNTDKLE